MPGPVISDDARQSMIGESSPAGASHERLEGGEPWTLFVPTKHYEMHS